MGGGPDPFKLPIIARGSNAHQVGKDLENVAAFGSSMNQQAQDLLMGAPAEVTERQLKDLHIRVVKPPEIKKD